MIEVTSTKVNSYVLPHLAVWRWEVPIYLFLGGLSAGLLVIASVMLLSNKESGTKNVVKLASLLSPIVLGIGMIFLLLDLEYKVHVWRFYTRFNPMAPMSWGSWILIVFMPFSFLQAFILYKDWNLLKKLPLLPTVIDLTEKHLAKIAVINVFMGSLVGIYTGILLSSLFARPLWASSALGVLFLLSGLSAGAALMALLSAKDEKSRFSKIDFYLIVLEAVVIAVFIIGALVGTESVESAIKYLIAGPPAPWFWGITIFIGLVIPFLMEGLEVLGKVKYSFIVPLLVLVGSISLRFIIVYAGQSLPTIS